MVNQLYQAGSHCLPVGYSLNNSLNSFSLCVKFAVFSFIPDPACSVCDCKLPALRKYVGHEAYPFEVTCSQCLPLPCWCCSTHAANRSSLCSATKDKPSHTFLHSYLFSNLVSRMLMGSSQRSFLRTQDCWVLLLPTHIQHLPLFRSMCYDPTPTMAKKWLVPTLHGLHHGCLVNNGNRLLIVLNHGPCHCCPATT